MSSSLGKSIGINFSIQLYASLYLLRSPPPQLDGSYKGPKQIADEMGHNLDTHLLSYARFKTRNLAESFDEYPVAK